MSGFFRFLLAPFRGAADRLWTLWTFSFMPRLSSVSGFGWTGGERRLRHIHVFWGVSEEGETLAASLVGDKSVRCRCLFVLPEDEWYDGDRYAAVAGRLRSAGHRVVRERLDRDGNWYETAGRHFLLGSDERENARRARLLVGAAVRRGVLRLDVYVRGRTPKEIDGVNIHHVEHADNAARSLFNAHPVWTCRSVTADPETFAVRGGCRLLIVGFDEIGKAVLKHHLMRGPYPGLALKTDVVSASSDELGTFRLLHGEVFSGGASGEVVLHGMNPRSPDFLKWIAERRGNFDRVVICPEGGIDTIGLGEKVARMLGGSGGGVLPEIFAYDPWFESAKRRAKVKTFGKTSDMYSREMVVDGLRISHLPAAMMAELPQEDGAAWRKTFCHSATDRMLDLIRMSGCKVVKRASDSADSGRGGRLVASVTANLPAVASAFGAARQAFMAWKGLPADTFADCDGRFAEKFFEIFRLGETMVCGEDAENG